MFHVFLILFALVGLGVVAVIGAIILFFITLLLASIFGGASAALIVKDKSIRQLLLMGFSMMFLSASALIIPLLGAYIEIPVDLYPYISAAIFIVAVILSISGIKTANALENRVGRIAAIIVYSIVCVFTLPAVLIFGILTLSRNFLVT